MKRKSLLILITITFLMIGKVFAYDSMYSSTVLMLEPTYMPRNIHFQMSGSNVS